MTAFLLAFGPWEIGIIGLVVLLLFGNRIPGMARNLGSGIVEFKRGLKSGDESSEDDGAKGSGSKTPPSASSKD